jgi:phosphoserine phosphatase
MEGKLLHPKVRDIRMVVFDLDGVLVDVDSSWQVVHRAFGADNEENYRRYMLGEIDFKEFMRSDIRLWGRAHISQIERILDGVPLMKGAEETVDRLKEYGYKTAIISSGISILADRVRASLGIDHAFANKLLTDENGRLTGEGKEEVELSSKVFVLRRLASMERMKPTQCAVVGDGIFDIPMFEEAGFSVAFNAQDERAVRAADIAINEKDLRKVLAHLV